MVHLRDYLDARRIALLAGGGKEEALLRLIELSRSDALINDFDRFRQEVLKRESIVTTGIGMGVAIPHVKSRYVKSFFITVGVFQQGIDWDALDGQPVYIVFLIGGPEDHQQYLQILAKLTLIIRNEEKRRAIITAATAEDVLEQFASL
jgi:PTS system nitrogen regulatory IIA component